MVWGLGPRVEGLGLNRVLPNPNETPELTLASAPARRLHSAGPAHCLGVHRCPGPAATVLRSFGLLGSCNKPYTNWGLGFRAHGSGRSRKTVNFSALGPGILRLKTCFLTRAGWFRVPSIETGRSTNAIRDGFLMNLQA